MFLVTLESERIGAPFGCGKAHSSYCYPIFPFIRLFLYPGLVVRENQELQKQRSGSYGSSAGVLLLPRTERQDKYTRAIGDGDLLSLHTSKDRGVVGHETPFHCSLHDHAKIANAHI